MDAQQMQWIAEHGVTRCPEMPHGTMRFKRNGDITEEDQISNWCESTELFIHYYGHARRATTGIYANRRMVLAREILARLDNES